MDLVDNNLHRSIPKCINNFSVMVTIYPVPSNIGYFTIYCNDNLLGGLFEDAIVSMKGKLMKYNTILNLVRSIDLSNNKFIRKIPIEVTEFKALQSLNLSHNFLTGKIPENIGTMRFLESIDFSTNQLHGNIPEEFENGRSRDGNEHEVDWFYVSMSLGFVMGFWGIIGPLIASRRWSNPVNSDVKEFTEMKWVYFCRFLTWLLSSIYQKIYRARRLSMLHSLVHNHEMTVYFFAHVDDILLIGTSSKYIQELVADLNKEFAMIKGVGGTIGALQYITLIRLDVSFPVNKLSQFYLLIFNGDFFITTQLPWRACNGLLRGIRGTLSHGLVFKPAPLVKIEAYSDANWAGDTGDRRRTSRYGLLENLLNELQVKHMDQTTVVWCDNVSAGLLASNFGLHSRTEHIDIHFIRSQVTAGVIAVQYVASEFQIADTITKPPSAV
ncbi:uncharacterized protein LOC123194870 [Mangifera indica]|uniref:uncharacterized protein LOC123194870 n=1 Tax=Mangifera indica TaxID=29780 RepID=UPI001CFA47FF|nr:uncharacterized protein LOC123194870 [Mangifera indica]